MRHRHTHHLTKYFTSLAFIVLLFSSQLVPSVSAANTTPCEEITRGMLPISNNQQQTTTSLVAPLIVLTVVDASSSLRLNDPDYPDPVNIPNWIAYLLQSGSPAALRTQHQIGVVAYGVGKEPNGVILSHFQPPWQHIALYPDQTAREQLGNPRGDSDLAGGLRTGFKMLTDYFDQAPDLNREATKVLIVVITDGDPYWKDTTGRFIAGKTYMDELRLSMNNDLPALLNMQAAEVSLLFFVFDKQDGRVFNWDRDEALAAWRDLFDDWNETADSGPVYPRIISSLITNNSWDAFKHESIFEGLYRTMADDLLLETRATAVGEKVTWPSYDPPTISIISLRDALGSDFTFSNGSTAGLPLTAYSSASNQVYFYQGTASQLGDAINPIDNASDITGQTVPVQSSFPLVQQIVSRGGIQLEYVISHCSTNVPGESQVDFRVEADPALPATFNEFSLIGQVCAGICDDSTTHKDEIELTPSADNSTFTGGTIVSDEVLNQGISVNVRLITQSGTQRFETRSEPIGNNRNSLLPTLGNCRIFPSEKPLTSLSRLETINWQRPVQSMSGRIGNFFYPSSSFIVVFEVRNAERIPSGAEITGTWLSANAPPREMPLSYNSEDALACTSQENVTDDKCYVFMSKRLEWPQGDISHQLPYTFLVANETVGLLPLSPEADGSNLPADSQQIATLRGSCTLAISTTPFPNAESLLRISTGLIAAIFLLLSHRVGGFRQITQQPFVTVLQRIIMSYAFLLVLVHLVSFWTSSWSLFYVFHAAAIPVGIFLLYKSNQNPSTTTKSGLGLLANIALTAFFRWLITPDTVYALFTSFLGGDFPVIAVVVIVLSTGFLLLGIITILFNKQINTWLLRRGAANQQGLTP